MPDQEPVTGHSARLLRGLIWAGVLLAPLAAAVVLLGGSSGSVRFAVLLIAISVVLIGASMLIRNDPVLQRMDIEDRVAEEIATLRRELRAEFGRVPDRSGAAPVRAGAAPVRGGGVAAVRSVPPPEEGGFFGDVPMPEDDPFATPMPAGGQYADDQYAAPMMADDQYAGPLPADEPYAAPIGPAHPEPAFGAGGRASVPVAAAAAAVRPVPGPLSGAGPGLPPRGPGMAPPPGRQTGPVMAPPPGRQTGPGMTPPPGRQTGPGMTPPPGRQTGPGMTPPPGRQTGPGLTPPPGREPGMTSGARPPAPAAVSPAIGAPVPRQRGAVPVAPPAGAPRAAAAVRPGAVQYGGQALDADFGASTGYAGVNPAPGGSTYGAPADAYGPAVDEGYEQFGQVSGDYQADYGDSGYAEGGYAEHGYAEAGYSQAGYGEAGYGETGYADTGYDGYPEDPDGYADDQPPTSHQAADPNYRARRHRPSANDTNIGTLADFAAMEGYSDPPADERYVAGYEPDPPAPGGYGRRR